MLAPSEVLLTKNNFAFALGHFPFCLQILQSPEIAIEDTTMEEFNVQFSGSQNENVSKGAQYTRPPPTSKAVRVRFWSNAEASMRAPSFKMWFAVKTQQKDRQKFERETEDSSMRWRGAHFTGNPPPPV